MFLDKFFYNKLILLLYLLVGFVPYFGSVDLIGPQWFYLSIVNFISFLYLFKYNLLLSFNKLLSYLIISFLFFSLISSFNAINFSESLIEISRLFTLFLSLFCIYNLSIINIDFNNFIPKTISIVLLFELLYFFILFFLFSDKRGIAGNINVAAMSLVIKIPFILYLIYNNFRKLFLAFLIFLCFSAIFLIGSRTSFLAVIFILITTFILYNNKNSFYYTFVPSLCSFFTIYFLSDKLNAKSTVVNFTVSDVSTTERLMYYMEAFGLFLNNPFSGIGLGNWKLESIKLHSDFIKSYIVPYHVHNDFLQILVESGIFAFIIFCSIFSFFFFIIFKIYNSKLYKSDSLIYFVLLSICLYLIDSLFNFPIARPLTATYLMMFFAIVLNFIFKAKFITTYQLKRYHLIILLPFLISTSYSNFKVFDSFRAQKFLLEDFLSQSFDTDINFVESISSTYPSIVATTLPIDALKANYYLDNIDTTLILLNKASIANPYIKYPEFLKSIQLKKLSKLDSSLYYAADAFNSIPLNEFHAVNYLQSLALIKDSLEMNRVYEKTKNLKSKAIIYNFLLQRSQFDYKLNDPYYIGILESNKNVLADQLYNPLFLIFKYGKERIEYVNRLNQKADLLVKNLEYEAAAIIYLSLYETIPDIAYLENAGSSFYKANINNKASKIFLNIINNNKSQSGKSQFLYGLMMYETNNPKLGCKYLLESKRLGYAKAEKTINTLCVN